MSAPTARRLPGDRLHLQHGPIDLIIWAEGNAERAYRAAQDRFATVLTELVEERDLLQQSISRCTRRPRGETARKMRAATLPFSTLSFVTPMAAVAGAVADTILDAMTRAAALTRAYVNNGGDIALHLDNGQSFRTAMLCPVQGQLGEITIPYDSPVRGIATSGRHGRSFSLGIADSVTVLARTGSAADAAATLIGNAVDLPGNASIHRCRATEVDEMSDLKDLLVTLRCDPLSEQEIHTALSEGMRRASKFEHSGLIEGASLNLQGRTRILAQQSAPYFQPNASPVTIHD